MLGKLMFICTLWQGKGKLVMAAIFLSTHAMLSTSVPIDAKYLETVLVIFRGIIQNNKSLN